MSHVSDLQSSYDGEIPAGEMARAITMDAERAASPGAAHSDDIEMFQKEVAHYCGEVLSKITEARKGTNPYSRDGIKAHLRTLHQRQAQLRTLQVAA